MPMPRTVAEMVRRMVPSLRRTLTPEEHTLSVYLRGNEDMFNSLKGIIESRMKGRAGVPEPSDPVECKSMVARDRELLWLLAKLEFIYRSPIAVPTEQIDDEQPA